MVDHNLKFAEVYQIIRPFNFPKMPSPEVKVHEGRSYVSSFKDEGFIAGRIGQIVLVINNEVWTPDFDRKGSRLLHERVNTPAETVRINNGHFLCLNPPETHKDYLDVEHYSIDIKMKELIECFPEDDYNRLKFDAYFHNILMTLVHSQDPYQIIVGLVDSRNKLAEQMIKHNEVCVPFRVIK